MLSKICSIFLVFLIAGSLSAKNSTSTSTPKPFKDCEKNEDCPKGEICEGVRFPRTNITLPIFKICRIASKNASKQAKAVSFSAQNSSTIFKNCTKNEDCPKGLSCINVNILGIPFNHLCQLLPKNAPKQKGVVSSSTSTPPTPKPYKDCVKNEDCPKGHVCEDFKWPLPIPLPKLSKYCRDPKNPIFCEKNEDCKNGDKCYINFLCLKPEKKN